MNIKHWIIGGTLALFGVGSAAASTVAVDAQDASAASRITADTASGGGDVVTGGSSRGEHASGSSHSASDDGTTPVEGLGGSSNRPASHPHRLGWQSLLPGSIQ